MEVFLLGLAVLALTRIVLFLIAFTFCWWLVRRTESADSLREVPAILRALTNVPWRRLRRGG